jgi:hypothetical protein
MSHQNNPNNPNNNLSKTERDANILESRLHGKSLSEISKEFDLSISQVKKICDKQIQHNLKDNLIDVLDLHLSRIDDLYRQCYRIGNFPACLKILNHQATILNFNDTKQLSETMKEHILLMQPTNDSALETYRKSQAELAQLKLNKEKNKLIDKEVVKTEMENLGNQLKYGVDKLEKLYGPDASNIIKDLIIELENKEFKNNTDDDNEDDNENNIEEIES